MSIFSLLIENFFDVKIRCQKLSHRSGCIKWREGGGYLVSYMSRDGSIAVNCCAWSVNDFAVRRSTLMT